MIKAIIFDFDGVLVQSSRPRFDALQKAAQRYDVEIENSLFAQSVGLITVDFMNRFFPTLDDSLFQKILTDYQKEYKDKIIEHTIPISFTNDFIRSYRGSCAIAVASTNNLGTLKAIIRHLGLHRKVQLITGRENVQHHKPHPEIYLYTAEKLGVKPSECVVVEDSYIGVLAANKAGMRVYGLLNGTNTSASFEGLKVEGFLNSLPQLKDALIRGEVDND